MTMMNSDIQVGDWVLYTVDYTKRLAGHVVAIGQNEFPNYIVFTGTCYEVWSWGQVRKMNITTEPPMTDEQIRQSLYGKPHDTD